MNDLDPNTKGGLVAVATAFVVFLLLMAISSGEGAIRIVIGAIMILAVVIWVMSKSPKITASSEQIEQVESFADASMQPEAHHLKEVITGKIRDLFGTTDMDQITGSVKAMYTELSKLRANNNEDKPDLSAKVQQQEDLMDALRSERDKAQALVSEWEAKAINSSQEVEQLKKEMEERLQWELVDEEQIEEFFSTVTIKDGDNHNAFLESKRRQRRLMQRMSAEGYFIVQKVD